MNFDTLKTQSREQLMELAGKMGLQVHWKAKPETIIKQIMDKALAPEKPNVKQVEAKSIPQTPHNTPEGVREAIADILAKKPEFIAEFPGDNTWIFKYKGAEESGNMDIPLRLIKQKAVNVARGRLALMGLNQHFDQFNTQPHSAYTNTVIAG